MIMVILPLMKKTSYKSKKKVHLSVSINLIVENTYELIVSKVSFNYAQIN